ncbi:hypothetical protein [Micromonospora sp. CB01531]|uniref:hypothetical protein n=1 Tax=Micromonospora sp. CB01531 TaxID=1718947 RepID=UPI00093EB0FC|nr:hypothetical protein [Micromonospora sp. CB01531]OKI52867.1 hypothetical protein A6A27_08240 [Micromonospora sp. CB01531]
MTHADTATDLAARAEARRVYGPTIDALLDHRIRLARVCNAQQVSLNIAWGRVDELHRAVTNADAERDRYREQADRANAERLRLAEELTAAHESEAQLRQRIARDLRGTLLTSLVAALIVNASPSGPSAYELAARLLGELADLTDGSEPILGRPISEWQRHVDDLLLRSLPAAPVPPAAPAAAPPALPAASAAARAELQVRVDTQPRRRSWWRRINPI